jgi:hypothetical protein
MGTTPPSPRAALPALALLGALLLPSCGGDPEKAALPAYQAALEDAMAQDERISADLKDLRADLGTGHARKEDQSTFGGEQALPFYRRFRETAGAIRPEAPRLQKVHAVLREYIDARVSYLESFDAFLKASDNDSQRRLETAQAPLLDAEDALRQVAGTGSVAPEVAQAFLMVRSFVERVYGPFQRGQATSGQVEEALRKHLVPALDRAADATQADLASADASGAAARWVKAAKEFYQALGQALPQQEQLQKSGLATKEHWDRSEDLRGRFLAEFRTYRESLR